MTLVTIYALFGDDFRMLVFNKGADTTFNYLTVIAMGLFVLEIILSSIAKEGYFPYFYFWLDLIASASLIFDITWFWDLVLGTDTSGSNNAQAAAKAAKAGRGARVGTRASRIARIVRLIRLIRVVKLYKSANAALYKEDELLEDNQISP
mmetsp:Transcript_21847/g.16205  ORF Transcript_21847/g.16205 Transcript_21847/m.16205 type:complete len:150 (+) Transcript_21847:368-817(+)